MQLPKTRNENIVIQDLKNEVLIYDLLTHKAFHLNNTSAKVFNACDGIQTFDDLKNKHQFTDEIIFFALDELKRNNLLTGEYVSPVTGMNRREVIKKIGLASMVALPVILSLVAPKAANAQSATTCNVGDCSCNCIFGAAGCNPGDPCANPPGSVLCPNPACTCVIGPVPGPDNCIV